MATETLLRGITAVSTAQDYVKLPGYRALAPVASSESPVREYANEEAFWTDALATGTGQKGLSAGSRVLLRGFRLSHWVPRVPGVYWKVESGKLREAAAGYRVPPGAGLGLYTPVGKTMQVLGGMGTVRLLPAASGRLVGASSSGNYWQGVPVLVQGDAWEAYGDLELARQVDVEGVWTPIPREYAQALGGDTGIPRYCLLVAQDNAITARDPGYGGSACAWTLFEYRDQEGLLLYDFSYCTFPVESGSTMRAGGDADSYSTAEAAQFLGYYIDGYKGEVLTDFDEEVPRFEALLPVSELMNSQVDQRKLRAFVDRVKKRALSPEYVKYDKLPQILARLFDAEKDLHILALDYVGVELDHLVGPAAGLDAQVEALMEYCEQQDKLEELLVGVVKSRPQVQNELTANP